MLPYFFVTITALLCFFTAWTLLGTISQDNNHYLCKLGLETDCNVEVLSLKKRLLISILIALMTVICGVKVVNNVSSWISLLKLNIATVCMTGSGCVDAREKRIPNIFPAIMSISGVILLIVGVLTGQDGAFAYIASSLFATLTTVLVLMIAAALTKGGIGPGDIKLLGALALLCGVYTIGGTAIIGVSICALYSIFLLVTKRKGLKESLPFGPFLLAGFFCSVMLGYY